MSNETNWNKWRLWRTVPSPILSRQWPMNAGSDWPSSRALLTLKPSRRRWTLNSTWTIHQTARNCAGQFSIPSPEEKCQSKKALPSVVDCYFHHRMNFVHSVVRHVLSTVPLIFRRMAYVPERFPNNCDDRRLTEGQLLRSASVKGK